ncbi:MAG: hypothetical protein WB662_09255 [Methyloceanibacter sp.]
MGDTRRVLYRLPEIIQAVAAEKIVFVVEGEKAADALARVGVSATCSPGGAGKWRKEYSTYLAGADVVILPDADSPGEQHCEAVAASLTGIAARVRGFLLRMPGLPPKGDVYDWLAQGGDAEQLWNLVEGAAVDWRRADAPKGRAKEARA